MGVSEPLLSLFQPQELIILSNIFEEAFYAQKRPSILRGFSVPQKPPNHPENRLFRPEFHLLFSQISQKPWGGLVGLHIWQNFPTKKRFCFWGAFL